jgi:hypothetical protein
MPRITDEDNYGAALEKMQRLGLQPLYEEIKEILTGFTMLVKEAKDANGGAAVRKIMDARFVAAGGWTQKITGDIDWSKCHTVNGTSVCIGVELQFSARSDLIIMDIVHLRRALTGGAIDVGVLVVANDRLGPYLTDRGPRIADARRLIKEGRTEDLPLVVIGLEHDGPGPALPKQPKRSSKRSKPRNKK